MSTLDLAIELIKCPSITPEDAPCVAAAIFSVFA